MASALGRLISTIFVWLGNSACVWPTVRRTLHYMSNTNVLISGASIAGPALAYWLSERGFTPTVVERAPAPRPGGQTVDLRGAGRTVVDRMGLMARVREVSVDQRGFALVDTQGRVRAEMPADAFGGEGIISEIEVLRGDLGQVFYEASRPTTEYLRSEEHTSELQSQSNLVCRLLLEKKKKK